MVGDVIFFKKNSSFISRVIAYMTESEYSHVGLIVAYNKHTNVVEVIESNRFVNTRKVAMKLDDCVHVIYEVEKTEKQENMILKYANKAIGMKYDYAQLFGIFISLLFDSNGKRYFNSKNKLICSELIDIILFKSGVKRNTYDRLGNITPQELLNYYEFKVKR